MANEEQAIDVFRKKIPPPRSQGELPQMHFYVFMIPTAQASEGKTWVVEGEGRASFQSLNYHA
jgi:hypothetical protein